VLLEVVQEGRPASAETLPAWGKLLSPGDIASIIASFQSRWPDRVYEGWGEIDRRSRRL